MMEVTFFAMLAYEELFQNNGKAEKRRRSKKQKDDVWEENINLNILTVWEKAGREKTADKIVSNAM